MFSIKNAFVISSVDLKLTRKLMNRLGFKTFSSFIHYLTFYFDDVDRSVSDCQKHLSDLRSALCELLGVDE